MKLARKHEKVCWYADYVSNSMVKDSEGNYSGEQKVTYSNPKMARLSVGLPTGNATYNPFGQNLDYDKELKSVDRNLTVSETSVFWIDTKPVINTDGSTDTPHDYIVKAVRKNLNITAIAVSKVKVS